MKNKSLLISLCFLMLSGCNSGSTSNSEDVFYDDLCAIEYGIDYDVNSEFDLDDTEKRQYKPYLLGSRSAYYLNDKREQTDFYTADFGYDYSSLIAGDALLITHNGSGMYTLDKLPSITLINGMISEVKVKHTQIYEIILRKQGEKVTFEHVDSSVEIEIGHEGSYNGICFSKIDGLIYQRKFTNYEDGTKLYYAYNSNFDDPNRYTVFYDFLPR